jgi:hypothetical protein
LFVAISQFGAHAACGWIKMLITVAGKRQPFAGFGFILASKQCCCDAGAGLKRATFAKASAKILDLSHAAKFLRMLKTLLTGSQVGIAPTELGGFFRSSKLFGAGILSRNGERQAEDNQDS